MPQTRAAKRRYERLRDQEIRTKQERIEQQLPQRRQEQHHRGEFRAQQLEAERQHDGKMLAQRYHQEQRDTEQVRGRQQRSHGQLDKQLLVEVQHHQAPAEGSAANPIMIEDEQAPARRIRGGSPRYMGIHDRFESPIPHSVNGQAVRHRVAAGNGETDLENIPRRRTPGEFATPEPTVGRNSLSAKDEFAIVVRMLLVFFLASIKTINSILKSTQNRFPRINRRRFRASYKRYVRMATRQAKKAVRRAKTFRKISIRGNGGGFRKVAWIFAALILFFRPACVVNFVRLVWKVLCIVYNILKFIYAIFGFFSSMPMVLNMLNYTNGGDWVITAISGKLGMMALNAVLGALQ
ncbi:hypothetical protein BJ875DRAFT_442057 [Amylocarpus encephaloides]|uniref:Uncharacterized protein n=1 Tax=Amylocarpus encephaloides TaxID=45428 RepID=A0A9P8C4Y3_9HELO|nr:hypothetical protein BJ875DRAFT_442057 [Amylocarpus encephaloides]